MVVVRYTKGCTLEKLKQKKPTRANKHGDCCKKANRRTNYKGFWKFSPASTRRHIRWHCIWCRDRLGGVRGPGRRSRFTMNTSMKATRVNSRQSDIWQRWEHPDGNASSYAYVNSCKGLSCALNQAPKALVLVLALRQNKQPRWGEKEALF